MGKTTDVNPNPVLMGKFISGFPFTRNCRALSYVYHLARNDWMFYTRMGSLEFVAMYF